jgi:hypothetical protein
MLKMMFVLKDRFYSFYFVAQEELFKREFEKKLLTRSGDVCLDFQIAYAELIFFRDIELKVIIVLN